VAKELQGVLMPTRQLLCHAVASRLAWKSGVDNLDESEKVCGNLPLAPAARSPCSVFSVPSVSFCQSPDGPAVHLGSRPMAQSAPSEPKATWHLACLHSTQHC